MLGRKLGLTAALEDYLETIFDLVRKRSVARVRDIAGAREVKPASVTPALKRLNEMGLIDYEKNEFVKLTSEGEQQAQRILSRHRLMVDFLEKILHLDPQTANRDACAMEHSLSDATVDRLASLFEFMQSCPDGLPNFLQRFHDNLEQKAAGAEHQCRHECDFSEMRKKLRPLAALEPGQAGWVRQLNNRGPLRQRLLDMGMLPGTELRVERTAPGGDPIWISLQGYQLSLRREEAADVLVEPAPPSNLEKILSH